LNWSIFIPAKWQKIRPLDFGEGEKTPGVAGWNWPLPTYGRHGVGLNQAIVTRDATQQSLDDLLALAAPTHSRPESESPRPKLPTGRRGAGGSQGQLNKARAAPPGEQID